MSKKGTKISLAEANRLFSGDVAPELPSAPRGADARAVMNASYESYGRNGNNNSYGNNSYARGDSFNNNDRNDRREVGAWRPMGQQDNRGAVEVKKESRAEVSAWRSDAGNSNNAASNSDSGWGGRKTFINSSKQTTDTKPVESKPEVASVETSQAQTATNVKAAYIPPSKRNQLQSQPQTTQSQEPVQAPVSSAQGSSNLAPIAMSSIRGNNPPAVPKGPSEEFPILGASKPKSEVVTESVSTKKVVDIFSIPMPEKLPKKKQEDKKESSVSVTSDLYRAFEAGNSISIEELNLGFKDLNLKDAKIKSSAPNVFAKSVVEGRLKLAAVLSTLATKGDTSEIALLTLQAIKSNSSVDDLLRFVDSIGDRGVPVCLEALKLDKLSKSDVLAFLEKNDLSCILPSNASKLLEDAVNSNQSVDNVLSIIEKNTRPVISDQIAVVESITGAITSLAITNADPASIIKEKTDLLKAVCKNIVLQKSMLFALQKIFSVSKPAKAVITSIVETLYESHVLSASSLIVWKDDKIEKLYKPQMLFALPKLLAKAEEAIKLQEPEPEEEDDEEEDSTLHSNLNYD